MRTAPSAASATAPRTAAVRFARQLTVATDGRFSRVRKLAELEPVSQSGAMEVLWFRLPRRPDDAARRSGDRRRPAADHRRARAAARVAVRLCRPAGTLSTGEGGGSRRVSAVDRGDPALARRPRRVAARVGRRESAIRRGEPAASLAPSGLAADRRRRARHAAGRRRRHQLRDRGRRRSRERL